MDQDASWYGGRSWPRPHCSRWGPSSPNLPSQKRGTGHPQFSAHIYCRQTAGWNKMPLAMVVGLGPGHNVLEGEPACSEKGHIPQFSAHVCCGQRAGWIKMPLCAKVGLCSGHIVLHGEPAHLPPQRGTDPQFLAHDYCGQMVAHLSYC